MPKRIQIRNVPDDLHRRLKARAAKDGKSLSDYLLGELERCAHVPTREALRERLHRRARVNLEVSVAEIVRHERESP